MLFLIYFYLFSLIFCNEIEIEKNNNNNNNNENNNYNNNENNDNLKCYLIPNATIKVTQYEAQRDSHSHHNQIIKKTTTYLNNHFTDIVSVNIDYDGKALSGIIGKYLVTAILERNINNIHEIRECYIIDYIVEDVNECETGEHKCHSTSNCVNTIGSYECECPIGYFGVEGSGSIISQRSPKFGLCGGEKYTAKCCQSNCGTDKACLEKCKSDFRCTNDPCLNNKCHPLAKCNPRNGTHTYTCQCPKDYVGDGIHCEKFIPRNYCDGPTTCLSPCVCVNHNSDTKKGYTCEAPAGYLSAHNPFDAPLPRDHYSYAKTTTNPSHNYYRLDHNYCFSREGMDLRLEGPNPVHYQQGDSYEEFGLQVSDSQPENFIRRVSIKYSSPFGQYFATPGVHHVNYTIQTPWIEGKPTITKTRKIFVSDVDECKYEGVRLNFRHQCSEEARCINTHGSYECICKPGYNGTGKKTPDGKSGCYDVRPPVLSCVGRGCLPMSFRAVSVVGIMSVDASTADILKDIKEINDYRFVGKFLEENKHLFCPANDPCFHAYDETLNGVIDLTSRVAIGDIVLVAQSGRQITFSVPYSVVDDADNLAGPLNLTINVELVDIRDHLSGNIVSVSKQRYFGVFVVALFLGFIFILFFLRSFITFLRIVLHAIQFAMYPYSLIQQRKDFEEGMDLVLQVMSFGTLSKTDRARKIASKWNSLIESYDEDKSKEE